MVKRPWQLPELSKKERKRLKKMAKLRDPFEIWIDHHNHKLEVLRTFAGVINAVIGFMVFLRVFHIV